MRTPTRAALCLLLAACAHAGRGPAAGLASAGLDDWFRRGDVASASARFEAALARDPADPWARFGAAALARRSLDDLAEVSHLASLLRDAPDHPLAAVAARRLGDLAELGPSLARAADEGLARALAAGRLRGLAAYRARWARAAAAESRGDLELAARLRGENGTVPAWTLVGPCGAYHALEMDRPFPPERGEFRCDPPAGVAGAAVRAVAAASGTLALEGEPPGADVYYLAADVRLSRGGRYLVAVGATAALEAFLDGEPLAVRRAWAGYPPTVQLVARPLAAGVHRVLLKLGRGPSRAAVSVSLAREDGAPSDAEGGPAAGPGVPVRRGPPPPALAPADRVRALQADAAPEVARWAVASDVLAQDREAAKGLLEEALRALPGAAPLHALEAEVLRDDPTLAERVARVRAEAECDRALARDPGDSATRLLRAGLARSAERPDDAQATLDALPAPDASRPRALAAGARLAAARGFDETAERLAAEAVGKDGSCAAAEVAYDLATRRRAVAREDELADALALCPGGRERLAEHRRRRGDAAGAAALLAEVVRAAPARVEARIALARALVARGDAAAAAAQLADLARIWPRDPRIERRRAEALELAGDRAGARAARERALALDGADLRLRRALALEDGKEVLADLAEGAREAIAGYEASRRRPSTSAVFVLDAAAVEAYPDGATTERVHELVKVLDQRGVDRFGEVTVPEGAEILSARNLKPDGRTLEPDDAGPKRAISIPGLEPGDYVEWEYLRAIPPRGAAVPGFTADAFFFRTEGIPMWRSTYAVAAPRGAGLEADAHHLPAPEVKVEGGREVVRVVAAEVPALVEEPGGPGISEYLPFVQVGAGAGREAMQLALADAFLERTRPSREVAAFAEAVRTSRPGAAPLEGEALLRAAYARVAEAVEGQGGAQADDASQVLSRGRGSRLLLLQSVCTALGLRSRLALVRPFTADPAPYRFPRPDLYGYAVLRVEAGGGVFWLDPSIRRMPFGLLPAYARGAEALLLPAPGEAPQAATTPEQPGRDGRSVTMRIELGPGGDASVTGTERYLGFDGAAAKASLEQIDAPTRRQVVEQGLARSFRGLVLESLEVEGERSAEEPLVLRYRARVPGLARVADGRAVVEAPIYPLRLGARYVSLASRDTPLLLATGERSEVRVEVVPPPGGRPLPAEASAVEGEFGSYRREEAVRDGALLRVDRFELARGRVAPGRYPAFARFASEVDEAQERPMALAAGR